MKVTKIVTALGFVAALGLTPALAQSTMGTMAPAAPVAAAPAAAAPVAAAPAVAAAKPAATKLTAAQEYRTVAAATAACPGDVVVWSALTKSKSFHLSTSKLYGKTKHGAYACSKAAGAAGFKAAKN